MRRKFHDPMTALTKRDPELVRLIHRRTQDAFRRYTNVPASPMVMASIETDLAEVFDEAQKQGADLPDHTVVALKFDAARRMQVSTVWHIKPWWPALSPCCIHIGTTGTVCSPEHTRPVDLWRCMETGETHVVWGEGQHERCSLPLFHVPHVVDNLHDGDERSVQVAIAERVVEKRPELMQHRPKRMN